MCLKNMGVGPLPVYIALIFFIQSFIIYTIAVIRRDVDPIFPYLSSAADRRPESCIFSMGTNISCVLIFYLIWIRFRQLRGCFYHYHNLKYLKLNWVSKWFGYLAVLGMFIVANVQETAVTVVHMSAAVCTFGGFTIWMMFQCYLSFKVTPWVTRRTVFFYRLIFTVLSFIFFFTSIGFGTAAAHIFHQTYPDLPTPRPWNRHFYQPGYELHQISAFAEWGCAISQVFFMLSFIPEFEDVNVVYSFESMYIDNRVPEHVYYDEEPIDLPPIPLFN
uniref:DNA damage-regulated autophagy modulator protein 1 n=1 Tax=Caenorhabditis tropicalis TaxID=1561998 RepID=A0A1I7T9S6_9PELO